jgi:tripartite-type tricarboxylate transporter receptor subunit TctC
MKLAPLALLSASLACAGAFAQAYPSKPIRMIVPFAPGGVLDGLMRPVALQLGEAMGQPAIPENRPGANTAVGTGLCAKGAPDGYTVCASGSGVLFNPLLYHNMNYSPEKELAPVTNMVFVDGVIVAHGSMPFNNLRELIAYAKANPGKLNFGSFGEGSPGHLYIEWVKNRAGVDIAHIPYKGAAPVIAANLANEVQVIYMAIGAVLPHIKSGRLKPIVLPATTRSRFLANVPTFVDEGFEFRPSSWFGLFVSSQTPRPIVDRLNSEVRRILLSPRFQEQVLTPQFYEPIGNTPEEFTDFLRGQRVLAAELVKISGMKPVDM